VQCCKTRRRLAQGWFEVANAQPGEQHELQFLPAALEIIETPTSAAGRIMMGVIVVLVSAAICWACVGQIDIVATANGRIIPSGQIKVIQPLEIGVVKRIRVADGDHVAAGDMLIQIDPTTGEADRDRIAHDLVQAELDIARLQAALALDSTTFVPRLAQTQLSPMRSVSNWLRNWRSTRRRSMVSINRSRPRPRRGSRQKRS
jgi:multidrug efflux pump subunit AcrA (membrane-fusion protein)